MKYQIDVSRRVRRQIEALPGHMRQRVKREIASLAFNPRPAHATELRGMLAGRYKITLDQYRLVYRIDDESAIVEVLKADKKNDSFCGDIT
jgi:mRNA-degrading endonuclease RelE of RelBE toxin-antitoxin system